MQLKIHRPRLLVAMLLLIGVMSTSVMLLADDGDEVIKTRFIPFPTVATKAPLLTEEQKQSAVSIVQESGIVESINGAQDWEASRINRRIIEGYNAASMTVVWKEPVDSSGPWVLLHCGGTLQLHSNRGFSGITRLKLSVDLENRDVLGYGVTGEPGEEAIPAPRVPDSPVKILDTNTREQVFIGSRGELDSMGKALLEKLCPTGK